MRALPDWNFVATLVAAVAGVVVPVWLWQADLSSKSVSMKLVSRVSLQPKEQESVPGMEISVDGSRLENPHLVVFEIKNDGSKPVPAADYESSLAIRVQGGASFVRARVTGRSPKDIDAEIATDKQSLSLKPTLLNPKDTITVTAITSGTVPVFDSKARIVGVSSIALVDGTLEKSGTAKRSFLLAAATLLLVASMIVFQ